MRAALLRTLSVASLLTCNWCCVNGAAAIAAVLLMSET